ncbi:MAG: hypothetical protein RMK94_10240 [Armatimonadota bacterium]|nr:hypothetical protein [Armatimonadota bacterium]
MKRSSIGFIVFLVVAFGAIYGVSRFTSRLSQPEFPEIQVQHEETAEVQKAADAEGQGSKPTFGESVKGSPDAKVKVIAVLPPSGCQVPTLRVLDEIAKADPKRVRVEIYGMGSPKGQEILQQYGATCASVFINGKTEFTLTSNGKARQVVCQKSPGMSYQSTDLIEIVDMELKRLYGKGFDEKTLKQLREKGKQIVVGGHSSESMESPKAKVTVEVLTPIREGMLYMNFSQIIKELEQLKEKYGDDLSVIIHPIATPEGQERMQELKLKGPAVIINGKVVHEIQGPNNTKREIITAFGATEGMFAPSDVVEVVVAYMKQAKEKK